MPEEVIAIVVDPAFGPRLLPMAGRAHVWIYASKENEEAARVVWAQGAASCGATLFHPARWQSPEEQVLDELDLIDLHHPFWRVMEVHGAALVPSLIEALRALGVSDFRPTEDGFIARRDTTPSL